MEIFGIYKLLVKEKKETKTKQTVSGFKLATKWLGKNARLWYFVDPTAPRVATSSDWFNFVLLDSDAGKLYVILKYFRDTDTITKSVSSNSSSKNSDPAKYVNSGKLKILK